MIIYVLWWHVIMYKFYVIHFRAYDQYKKHTQLMRNIVYLFTFYSSRPRHVSAGSYAIIKGTSSKLCKVCMNVITRFKNLLKMLKTSAKFL
jgi:hypothetical protein